MTAIQIFGDTPFEMSPKRFSALAEHQRAELVRLMVERGYGKAALTRILGQPMDVLARLRLLRSDYRLGGERAAPGEGQPAQPDRPGADGGSPKKGEVSQRGRRVLAVLARHGGQFSLGYQALGAALETSDKAVKATCGRLLTLGLIERSTTDGRGRITWKLTDKAHALLDKDMPSSGGAADA